MVFCDHKYIIHYSLPGWDGNVVYDLSEGAPEDRPIATPAWPVFNGALHAHLIDQCHTFLQTIRQI
jgi:hypothetical protein